jgi:hypothetical protein
VSIKIWEAYTVKPGHDVWRVMWDLRRRAEKNVRATLTKLYNELIEDAKLAPEARQLFTANTVAAPANFNYLTASRFVQDQFRQTLGRMERSIWDLSVSVVVRRRGQRCLLIPYAGSGLLSGSLAFMRRHKALADFHYQNQADRPKHISAQAWAARARVWKPLLEDDRWQDKLTLEIVSVEGWYHIDPSWDLVRQDVARRQRAGTAPEEAVEQALPG